MTGEALLNIILRLPGTYTLGFEVMAMNQEFNTNMTVTVVQCGPGEVNITGVPITCMLCSPCTHMDVLFTIAILQSQTACSCKRSLVLLGRLASKLMPTAFLVMGCSQHASKQVTWQP